MQPLRRLHAAHTERRLAQLLLYTTLEALLSYSQVAHLIWSIDVPWPEAWRPYASGVLSMGFLFDFSTMGWSSHFTYLGLVLWIIAAVCAMPLCLVIICSDTSWEDGVAQWMQRNASWSGLMAQARYTARTFGLVELHVCLLIAVVAWQPTEPANFRLLVMATLGSAGVLVAWPALVFCGAVKRAYGHHRAEARKHAILDDGTKGVLRTLVLGGSMLLYVLGIGWCAVLLVLFIGGGGGRERAWGLCMIFVLFPCFLWALGFGFFALRCLFASRFAIHRAEDVLRHIKLVQTRAALFVLSALFLPTATALLQAVRRVRDDPRFPHVECYLAAFPPEDAASTEMSLMINCDHSMAASSSVLSNAPHRAPRAPRPARRRARRVRDAHRRRRRPQHLRDDQRRVPGAPPARRAEHAKMTIVPRVEAPFCGVAFGPLEADSAAFVGLIKPFDRRVYYWKGLQLTLRLLVALGPQLFDATHAAAWATFVCAAHCALLLYMRPFVGAGVELRLCGVKLMALPRFKSEDLVAVVTEFALLVNAAVALGLAYGDSSHFFSTTIGHGEASGIALGLLVRTSLCYGVFALAMQRWTTIKAATGDAIVEFLVAAQLYEPAQRLAEGYTDADADADEGRLFDGEYALRRWVDDHRERSFVFARGGGSWFALCCRGANVERVSLTYWPSSETLLHLCIVHHQLGALAMLLDELSTAYENAVTSDGVDDETRTRCCALVAREDAAGKTMLGRLLEVAIADPLPPVSGAPAPAAGEPVSPYVPFGVDTPEHEAAEANKILISRVLDQISKLPDGLRGCCAGRWLVADVPPEDSKMGDLSATVARWEVTGFGPALDRVLGDADGFRGWSFHLGTHVSVDKFERRHSTAAVLDELVKQLTPAERFVAQRYLATLEARGALSPVGGVGGGGGFGGRRRSMEWGKAAAALTAAGGGRGGSQRSLSPMLNSIAFSPLNLADVDALDIVA